MRNFLTATAAAAVAVLASSASYAQQQLVIYTASDDVSAALTTAFTAKHPDIKIEVVEASTGPITERAIAEMANPQADVVYLVNDVALGQLKDAGVFEPYTPKDAAVRPEFLDPDAFFTRYFATTMCMVVNTERLAQKKLPMPTTWEDLIKPVYKNEISMPSPMQSGTGATIFTAFADAFGWPFIENLDENIYKYSDGGSGGAELAGTGEVAIGLSYDTTCYGVKSAGRPVEVVFGRITPNTSEGGGLVTGAPHPEQAKLFLDFMASKDAAEVLGKLVGATAVPGYGTVNLDEVSPWTMRRPVDLEAFRRDFAGRFLQN
jgi:iron(III) transport system substrate-binding protein